ncbi:MAG: fused MFS/spermidine synthase [Betaproteobacteria bacterium]|nr:fused MFS/spermidine synthase [Betaproteobacteria bacterium]
MLLYALTIFGSAFLLFLVQPIVAKQILPWFGGSAAVWATCLVFFQTTLLMGYAYADYTVRRFSARGQVRLHVALLVVSLIALPIVPGAFWKPSGEENPIWLILGLLFGTIGLPYFLLSTTSPLVQVWFARRFPGRNPYRLFALSNFASLLGLLGYPFLLEPWIATRMQAWGWSAGYALFVGLAAAAAFASLAKTRVRLEFPAGTPAGPAATGSLASDPRVPPAEAERPPTTARQVLWCALAATASVLLLAVSNHITQNVASVPLLWIAPLSLYLLTFILCFDGSGWYRRDIMLAMLAAALGVMAWTYADPDMTHELAIQVGVFCTGLFLACMFCHGELVRLKPAPAHLTRFYLMISLGGALGAALVGIVAPLVLPADFELGGALVVCALLLLWQVRREAAVYGVLALTSLFVTIGCGVWAVIEFYESAIVVSRNFYGVLRVQEAGTGPDQRRQLVHGNIMHGKQYLDADLKAEPSSYYTRTSGVGRVIEALHPRADPIKVGIIGLGAGTIATYGSKGDVYRFYDINPGVVEIAQRDFSYLKDSDATIELPLGDARLKLEREDPQGFDVLAIDAFSSDAIPVHLITREAMQVYLKHMKPDGVIAFHVTNRYLDLVPVVEGIAHELGLAVLWIDDPGADALGNSSSWVLVAQDAARLAEPKLAEAASDITPRRDWRVWTDDFNNLVQVMK